MDEFMNRSTAIIAIETGTLLLIGLIAIGGNIMVVLSIYRNPSLRTITNYFVFSISISDILFPMIGLPLTFFWSIKSRFTFDQDMCDFQSIVIASLTFVSILMVVFMAVNRFVRVCKPEKYKKVFNKITALSMIVMVWMTSFTVAILMLKVGDNLMYAKFTPSKIMCSIVYDGRNNASEPIANSILVFLLVIPVSIIIYCYFKVFRKIQQHKRNIAPSSNPNSLRTSVQEIKVTWTMFAVLLGYCLTWIPVLIVTIASNICSRYNYVLPRQVHMVVLFAASSSCAINPIIYGALNTAFRREYANIFRCG